MKKNIFVLLLIGIMGVIALCGCEKNYTAKETNIENMTECFIGQWKCTDSKYCRDDDKILLNFDIDSLYVEVNTKYRCAFPKGRYKYEFLADTLCIFMDNYCMSYVYSINSNNKNRMSLNYTGIVIAPANEPLAELNYNFKRIE